MIDYFTDPPVLSGVDYFVDPPALPAPQGLQEGYCADCSGRALVDAQYEGVVRCSACWSKFHNVSAAIAVPVRSAPRSYVVKPWIVQSERGALRIGTASLPGSPESDEGEAEVGRYRIITPARPAAPSELPAACSKLMAALPGAGHAADDISATYALAEDLKLERPVASVALRVRHFGYAIWRDGRPLTAQLADPMLRTCSVTEFTKLALGQPYEAPKKAAPAPKGPCPRCGQLVRWKLSPGFQPWAHTIKTQDGDKIKCLPNTTT
jgi:hypothetical protein